MEFNRFMVGSRKCAANIVSEPGCVVIQLMGELDQNSLSREIEYIKEKPDRNCLYVFCEVDDWNKELSPWSAPPVFGDEPFGSGAEDTLRFIENELISEIFTEYDIKDDCPIILAGYSLAGLFALWSSYQKDIFDAVAAVSPSVWFPGWTEYADENRCNAKNIYLSLGDKEEKTRNKIMMNVGNCIQKQKEILDRNTDLHSILEWNEGNHFKNVELRCAKGISWCLYRLLDAED